MRVLATTLGIGVTILVVGCREWNGRPDAGARPPVSQGRNARVREDIPFTPIPGEAAAANPCGPKSRRPCLLLGWEHYNWAWGYAHSAWFIDTDGNEYQFSFDLTSVRGGRPEDADPVRQATIDQLVSENDFTCIVAASTALPRRVTAVEVAHALSLLEKSRAASVEPVESVACNDGGGGALAAYLYGEDGNGSKPVVLEEEECEIVSKANPSRAARELAQWVHRLRFTIKPDRNAVDLSWRWDDAAARALETFHPQFEIASPDGGRVVFSRGSKTSRLRRLDARGAVVWTRPIRWADAAALVLDGDKLYAALYHGASSGCRVAAFGARSGAPRWEQHLQGMGFVAHSAYGNRVQMQLTPRGLVIYGNEWRGRYVEILAPADGRQLGHRLLEPEPKDPK